MIIILYCIHPTRPTSIFVESTSFTCSKQPRRSYCAKNLGIFGKKGLVVSAADFTRLLECTTRASRKVESLNLSEYRIQNSLGTAFCIR